MAAHWLLLCGFLCLCHFRQFLFHPFLRHFFIPITIDFKISDGRWNSLVCLLSVRPNFTQVGLGKELNRANMSFAVLKNKSFKVF
jgi:hypothetical protein